jgi:hypothetical protein
MIDYLDLRIPMRHTFLSLLVTVPVLRNITTHRIKSAILRIKTSNFILNHTIIFNSFLRQLQDTISRMVPNWW